MKVLKNFIKYRRNDFIEVLLYFYVILIPILMVPSLPVVGGKIQYPDLLFPVLFISLVILLLNKRIKLVRTYLFIPMSFYLIMHVLSIFNSVNVVKSLLEIFGVVYLILMFFVVVNLIYTRKILDNILTSWMIALGIVIICGFVGLVEVNVFKKGATIFMLTQPEPARYQLIHRFMPRVTSTLGNPNMLMSYLIISTGLLLCSFKNVGRIRKIFISVLLILSFFLALFTTSSGIVSLLVCIVIALSAFHENRKIALVIIRYLLSFIAAALFCVFAILTIWEPSKVVILDSNTRGEKNISIDFHRTNKSYYYKYALRMTRNHPFIGIGSGNFNENLTEYYNEDPQRDSCFKYASANDPHSTYLGLAAEIGLIGLLFFIIMIILFLKFMFNIFKNSNDQYISNLSLGIIACVIGILVQAIVMDVQNLRYLWFILGLGISLQNLVK